MGYSTTFVNCTNHPPNPQCCHRKKKQMNRSCAWFVTFFGKKEHPWNAETIAIYAESTNFVSPTITTSFVSQPLASAIGVAAKSYYVHSTANCLRFQIRCLSLPYNNPIVSYMTWKLGVTLSRGHPVLQQYKHIHRLKASRELTVNILLVNLIYVKLQVIQIPNKTKTTQKLEN